MKTEDERAVLERKHLMSHPDMVRVSMSIPKQLWRRWANVTENQLRQFERGERPTKQGGVLDDCAHRRLTRLIEMMAEVHIEILIRFPRV